MALMTKQNNDNMWTKSTSIIYNGPSGPTEYNNNIQDGPAYARTIW